MQKIIELIKADKIAEARSQIKDTLTALETPEATAKAIEIIDGLLAFYNPGVKCHYPTDNKITIKVNAAKNPENISIRELPWKRLGIMTKNERGENYGFADKFTAVKNGTSGPLPIPEECKTEQKEDFSVGMTLKNVESKEVEPQSPGIGWHCPEKAFVIWDVDEFGYHIVDIETGEEATFRTLKTMSHVQWQKPSKESTNTVLNLIIDKRARNIINEDWSKRILEQAKVNFTAYHTLEVEKPGIGWYCYELDYIIGQLTGGRYAMIDRKNRMETALVNRDFVDSCKWQKPARETIDIVISVAKKNLLSGNIAATDYEKIIKAIPAEFLVNDELEKEEPIKTRRILPPDAFYCDDKKEIHQFSKKIEGSDKLEKVHLKVPAMGKIFEIGTNGGSIGISWDDDKYCVWYDMTDTKFLSPDTVEIWLTECDIPF